MTAWETRPDCPIYCPSPKICWEPVHYSAPQVCLPPGVDPNAFQNYISLSEANALWMFGLIFAGGLAIGLLLCLLLFTGFSSCFPSVRRRAQNSNAPGTSAQAPSLANRSIRGLVRPSEPTPPSFPLVVNARPPIDSLV
uniref:Uncharacterized protein n=1 Tax=Globodera rostochiensis TaxID=31243 RepID=A0A914HM73_GLORO